MELRSEAVKCRAPRPEWHEELTKYQRPDARKAAWQLANTVIPYAGLWALMVSLLHRGVSYWVILPLIVLAAGFLVRIFIFFHDCGHDCFFSSRRANRAVGYLTGILTFTPFDAWKHQHALHHAGSGNLDRRGSGDIWTMTVEEYQAAPTRTRIAYRLMRNPFVLLLLGPLYIFLLQPRFSNENCGPGGRRSVIITNLALLGVGGAAAMTMGLSTYLLIQLPVIEIAGMFGVWLFYVQHQYEETYWAEPAEWDPVQASLAGSSYYKLPKVLQWFSGNIGLHHIHHLRARIPNYNLQACYDQVPAMQEVEPLTLLQSFRCLGLHLWDTQQRKMVGFRDVKPPRKAQLRRLRAR